MCSRKWWNVSLFFPFSPNNEGKMDNYLSEYRFWTIWCDILVTRGSYSPFTLTRPPPPRLFLTFPFPVCPRARRLDGHLWEFDRLLRVFLWFCLSFIANTKCTSFICFFYKNGQFFLFLRVCTFFTIFHVSLGKKGKMLVYLRVYVCVKAKLTFVSFFLLFFVHLSLTNSLWDFHHQTIFNVICKRKLVGV